MVVIDPWVKLSQWVNVEGDVVWYGIVNIQRSLEMVWVPLDAHCLVEARDQWSSSTFLGLVTYGDVLDLHCVNVELIVFIEVVYWYIECVWTAGSRYVHG